MGSVPGSPAGLGEALPWGQEWGELSGTVAPTKSQHGDRGRRGSGRRAPLRGDRREGPLPVCAVEAKVARSWGVPRRKEGAPPVGAPLGPRRAAGGEGPTPEQEQDIRLEVTLHGGLAQTAVSGDGPRGAGLAAQRDKLGRRLRLRERGRRLPRPGSEAPREDGRPGLLRRGRQTTGMTGTRIFIAFPNHPKPAAQKRAVRLRGSLSGTRHPPRLATTALCGRAAVPERHPCWWAMKPTSLSHFTVGTARPGRR